MVPKGLGVSSATELDGASVCIQTGTTTELNLADYFHSNGMKYEAVTIETNDEARQNYTAGRCDVYTTDASGLAATRSTFTDSGEPRDPARDHLQGAARAGDPPRRRPVVGHRDLGAERHHHGRGEGRHVRQRRRDEVLQGSGDPSPPRRRGEPGRGSSASAPTGPTTSSRRSATTARSSSATSASTRRSVSSGVSTPSGPTGVSSTPRRSVDTRLGPGLSTAPARPPGAPAPLSRTSFDGGRVHREPWADRPALGPPGDASGHRPDRHRGGRLRADRARPPQRRDQPRGDRKGIQLRLPDRPRRLRHHLLPVHRLHLARHAPGRGGRRHPQHPARRGLWHRGRHRARGDAGDPASVPELARQPHRLRVPRVHPKRPGAAPHPARVRDRGDHPPRRRARRSASATRYSSPTAASTFRRRCWRRGPAS